MCDLRVQHRLFCPSTCFFAPVSLVHSLAVWVTLALQNMPPKARAPEARMVFGWDQVSGVEFCTCSGPSRCLPTAIDPVSGHYQWGWCCHQTARQGMPEASRYKNIPSQRVTDLEAAIRQLRRILDSCTISASHEVSQAQKAILLLPHTAKGGEHVIGRA